MNIISVVLYLLINSTLGVQKVQDQNKTEE